MEALVQFQREKMRFLNIFAFTLVSTSAFADPVVYSSIIKGVTDRNGVYTKIFKKIFKEIDWRPEWVFLPPKRSMLLFKKSKEHCEIPGNVKVASDKLIASEPINYAKLYAFTIKGHEKINSLSDLKGKNVVARNGWILGDWQTKVKVNITKVDTEKQQYKMLTTKNRQIDSAVAYMPDFFSVLSDKEMSSLYYSKDFVLNRLEDQIVCFKKPFNRELIDKVNKVIRKYRKEGTLKRMLGELYIDP